MRRPVSPSCRSITLTLDLPVLEDAAAVQIYNALCELVDQFDAHYGEQICRFYREHDALAQPPPGPASDDPF
jgi:hypothetical protein